MNFHLLLLAHINIITSFVLVILRGAGIATRFVLIWACHFVLCKNERIEKSKEFLIRTPDCDLFGMLASYVESPCATQHTAERRAIVSANEMAIR